MLTVVVCARAHRGVKEVDASLPAAAAGKADDVTAQPLVRTLLAALDKGLACCDGDGCATPPRVSDDTCLAQKFFRFTYRKMKNPTAATSSSFRSSPILV